MTVYLHYDVFLSGTPSFNLHVYEDELPGCLWGPKRLYPETDRREVTSPETKAPRG